MTSFAFKPWARDASDAGSLNEILGRVHLERGHFRDITEASLQEEIAGEGALNLSESEDEDADDEQDEEQAKATKLSPREELWKAKGEMIELADSARNEVMFALDYVSLLMSKDAPHLGEPTMSAALRQNVPSGTLGFDKWEKMPRDTARETQDELLAVNVRMESLQQSADSLLAAATRLEDNVRKETQYWDQILSITEKGWNVCKIPGQQHRLGVTFGFSESLGQFSRQGIAALNASPDGGIALERGIGSKPRAVRVLLKVGDEILGSSKVPTLLDEAETTLEARIRHARDSLFDEELYHEMIRESRSQASLGVRTKGNCISFKPDTTDMPNETEVVFELLSLDEPEAVSQEARDQDKFAQAIALAARMLLSQAHRERLKKRSDVPPPMSERKEERTNLPILRPIMALVLHQAAIKQLNGYLERLESLLAAARLEQTVQRAHFAVPHDDIDSVEALIDILKQPWASEASVQVKDRSVDVKLETTLARAFGTVFTVSDTDSRALRYTSFEDMRQAIDGMLASRLALQLSEAAGGEWRCNRREASLASVDSEGEKGTRGSAWVTVDGEAGVMSLSSPTKKVVWATQGESPEANFEQAFAEIIG